jgi:hypothetical protein
MLTAFHVFLAGDDSSPRKQQWSAFAACSGHHNRSHVRYMRLSSRAKTHAVPTNNLVSTISSYTVRNGPLIKYNLS